MKGVVQFGRDQFLQERVGLLPGSPCRDQPQPSGHPVDVGVHGEGGAAEGEEKDNRRCLGADAGDGEKPGPCRLQRHIGQKIQGELPPFSPDAPQRLLNARSLGGRQSCRTNCRHQVLQRGVPDDLPGGKSFPQPLVCPVPIQVIGVLGEDGGDEDRNGVTRRPLGLAVFCDQSLMDATNPVGHSCTRRG